MSTAAQNSLQNFQEGNLVYYVGGVNLYNSPAFSIEKKEDLGLLLIKRLLSDLFSLRLKQINTTKKRPLPKIRLE